MTKGGLWAGEWLLLNHMESCQTGFANKTTIFARFCSLG